jgi:F0F1-type ATP synthase membrane subunit b/b'
MKTIVACVMSMGLGMALVGGYAVAKGDKPVENVSSKKHPNIASAQKLSEQAFEKVSAAQKANEWDMEGHAAKAKELLEQANTELRAAATAANKNAK